MLIKFCSYFVETFLFSEVKLYSNSKRSQLRSLAKFYAVDPLMAREAGFFSGDTNYWILENFVFCELKKRFKEVWYWHSKKKYEVDFIARDKNGLLYGFQVAQSIREQKTKTRELRALFAAFEELKLEKAFIITEDETENIKTAEGEVTVLPFYRWSIE